MKILNKFELLVYVESGKANKWSIYDLKRAQHNSVWPIFERVGGAHIDVWRQKSDPLNSIFVSVWLLIDEFETNREKQDQYIPSF
jgi:hypothetical protein